MTLKERARGRAMMGVCAAAMALATTPAFAQQTPQPQNSGASTEFGEIIVTASRRETNLQRTPISVTVVTGETLQERGSTSLADLAAFTPNLSIASNNGGGAGVSGSIAIRGMGVGAPESSGAVGVYVDEVFQPSTFGNLLGLLDVQRIEVLRGPQGTLFGRNTIAGAVQYVSRRPDDTLGGSLDVTGGSNDRYAANGAINLPLSDTLAVRLAASYDHRGGYVRDDFNNIDRGESEVLLGRAQLRWTPTNELTVDLKAEFARRDDNGRPVAIIGVNPNALFAGLSLISGETDALNNSYLSSDNYHFAGYNTPDYFRSRLSTYQAVVTYDLTDSLTFKSISAYVHNENRGESDFDMTPLDIFAASRGLYDDEVYTQEFQLAGSAFADRLDWTLGLYYFHGDLQLSGQSGIAGVPGFVPFPGAPPNSPLVFDTSLNEVRSIAGYGQGEFQLTDDLTFVLGLRYSHEEITGSDVTIGLSNEETFTDWSPHIGFNWQIADSVFAYVKASKGFRAGGFTINNALLGLSPPLIALPFDQEVAWTYEAGVRLDLAGGRLRVNPTIFLTEWSDIQFQRDIPVPAFSTIVGATQNAGDAEIRGFELEAQFFATERLQLTGSLSLLDSEYTRIEDFFIVTYPNGFLDTLPPPIGTGSAPVVLPNLSLNSPLQESPEYKYSIGVRYEHPLPGDARLIASAEWGYTDDFRIGVTDGSSQNISGYGILNGRLAYESEDGNFSIALFGTNLTDEYYFIGGDGKGKGFTVGTDQADVARPREWGIVLSRRF